MNFLIADTFTDSLARLTGAEQKAVKMTAFDLQLDPSAPSLKFHKLDHARDPNFRSVRVNDDIRLILHRTPASLLLVYVGHHDAAYKWAERRKIERHPTTGAMQLVEIRERFEEIRVSIPSPASVARPPAARPKLFSNLRKQELMEFGVPEEWVEDVRGADEDTLLDVIGHLPQEAQEELLKLAVGERPEKPVPAAASLDPFVHPDARRRFRIVENQDELRRALEFPWEKWAVFLHPAQRQLVERHFAGPARVSGSAGTGKTVVALHRAVFVARQNPGCRVLLATFSKALANALKGKLAYLVGAEGGLAERIAVSSMTGLGYELYAKAFGRPNIAPLALIRSLLTEAAAKVDGAKFSAPFLFAEWEQVVDAWQLKTWEAYRDVTRLGRKTRIGGKQREQLWSIFAQVHAGLAERKMTTWAEVFGRLTEELSKGAKPLFAAAVVDEAQDIGIAELRFLAALGSGRPNGLFFAGDLGQRIFQQPFSWRSAGVDVRGRSFALRINYRTSHQIRSQADRLLPDTVTDVDGNGESRRGTISVFDGPPPEIALFHTEDDEIGAVGQWIAARLSEGLRPEEIGIFVRSEGQMARARRAIKDAGARPAQLTDKADTVSGRVAVGTMHLAKGLEFRAVVAMACDDEVLPLQERIETATDEADLQEVYDTERHLLYVACTRARDHLMVSGVAPGSEFLGDLRP